MNQTSTSLANLHGLQQPWSTDPSGVLPDQRVEDDALSLSQLRLCTVAHCKRRLWRDSWFWVNYNDLTVLPNPGIIVNKGNHPQMGLIQVNYYELPSMIQLFGSLPRHAKHKRQPVLYSQKRPVNPFGVISTKGIRFDSTNLRPYCMKHIMNRWNHYSNIVHFFVQLAVADP